MRQLIGGFAWGSLSAALHEAMWRKDVWCMGPVRILSWCPNSMEAILVCYPASTLPTMIGQVAISCQQVDVLALTLSLTSAGYIG